jgi:hypothetical protein
LDPTITPNDALTAINTEEVAQRNINFILYLCSAVSPRSLSSRTLHCMIPNTLQWRGRLDPPLEEKIEDVSITLSSIGITFSFMEEGDARIGDFYNIGLFHYVSAYEGRIFRKENRLDYKYSRPSNPRSRPRPLSRCWDVLPEGRMPAC